MTVYKTLNECAAELQAGKVGVIPTDTIYGLVATAKNEQAVQKIYDLKQRDGKPGTIIAANVQQLVDLGIKKRYLTAVEHYWPNPISIEIPHQIAYLHQGTMRQAMRIPDDTNLLNLLEKTGPLQTSSANITGKPSATSVQSAQDYFGDSVDFYVDGGDLANRPPSTVIKIVDDTVEVVREGAIKIDERGARP